MFLNIKKRILKIAEIIHLKIFDHEMGIKMKRFLTNLSWSFFGGFIATGMMFALNMVAGRILGPEEYGKYSSAVVLTGVLATIFVLNLDISSIRYLADRKYKKSLKKYLQQFSLQLFLGAYLCHFFNNSTE